MAAAIGFSSFITGQCLPTKRTTSHSICVSARKSHQLLQAKVKRAPHTYMKKAKSMNSLKLFAVPPSRPTFDTSSLSPTQTIMQFYSSINEKNLAQLDHLIAEDCFFEDYSFPNPFQGKKEVMHFLEQLTMCMGDYKNMQFNVELICEGNDYTAAVNWHLEWKKIQVPFTRGCSYCSLSVIDDELVIKKAKVLIESPIKLGVIALSRQYTGSIFRMEDITNFYQAVHGFLCSLLSGFGLDPGVGGGGLWQAIFKIVSSLFDAFPAATEWFLKSPHIMFRLILKAYNIAVKPVINPFLAWYIKLLNLAACILSITLKILYYLSKFFHM